ncbi:unnamed protein product [Amaranthus hypochondriacus]
MITLGLEQEFSSNKREMNEIDLEEGEACSYQDFDSAIDPDVALSYIDEKLQNVLGHFKKDFEGVVSAESLGAKFGSYGSFLPAHRRSPVHTHSKTPPRVQNHVTHQSPNTFQAEVAHHNSLGPANASYSTKQGSASSGSASSFAHKPPPQNDSCLKNASTKPNQLVEVCSPKSEVRDHNTLKFRIKVGSENLSDKKNAEIYSGLGLVVSPTSSPDESPMESEGLSCDDFESPTRILQMMTSSPLCRGRFLSPLPNNLICLSERPKSVQNIFVQPSSNVKLENSVIGHPSFSVKDKKTISGENCMKLLDKKGLVPQDKADRKESSIHSPFHSKEMGIDAVSYEELVSDTLKLPLLSNEPIHMKGSPKASLKEEVFCDTTKREPFEPVSVHVSLNEKSNEKMISAGTIVHNKVCDARKNMMTESKKVGDSRSETVDSVVGVTNLKKASKFGLRNPVNHKSDSSIYHDDAMILPSGNEQFSSGDEKRPKKSQVHGFANRKKVMEIGKDSDQVLKDRMYSGAENNACMRKDSAKARDQYADFFGELNENEDDIDSPVLPSGEMLKTSEIGEKTMLAFENTSKVKTSSIDTYKGPTSGVKVRGSSNFVSVQENFQPISEPAPIPVVEDDNWVLCDKCQKWRLFPPGSKVDNLPDKWDCSMMTWLPGRNRCSVSEEETNNYHAPPLGLNSANILSSVLPINGKVNSKGKKPLKPSLQDSPSRLPSSKKKQQLGKGKTLKEAKDSFLTNGLDLQQQPNIDIFLETGSEKKTEKRRTDRDSDGHTKILSLKGKREFDQELHKSSKKSKTQSAQSGDNYQVTAAHDQGIESLGVNAIYGFGARTTAKGRASSSYQNSKDDMLSTPSEIYGKSKFQVEAHPAVGSVFVGKSGSGNKKRKGDKLKDSPSSTPSSCKMIDDDKSSRKRHKMSKSEGKESSLSKRHGKVDKKSKNVSHQRLDGIESLQKDLSCVNPVVAATSSSSKVSGSLRVRYKAQEIKGSPVESVSSSPCRIPNSDKLTSGYEVIGNNNVQGDVNLETGSPRRFSSADYEGNGDQSGARRKGVFVTGTLNGSLNGDMHEKNKGGLPVTNGNSSIDYINHDNGYSFEAQVSYKGINETSRAEVHTDANVSNSKKSWKDSRSLSKDKNQTSNSNSGRGKVKMSVSDDKSKDLSSVNEKKERNRKEKVGEKCASKANKTENCTLADTKDPGFLNSERRQENDERRSSKRFDVEKSEELVPISAKEKSRHILQSDGERNEGSNTMQPCQKNKASTSACDVQSDGRPREPRTNKKTDSHNGTHTPSKNSISNGHKMKNQDAPSPLRRDSSSQAASSAIKEATLLKHMADRQKSSGSSESTGMYFDAALKFLHGASLLESGKTENIKHAEVAPFIPIYSDTAKLCQYCAHEYEKSKDMASAALAYKCVELAFMRVIYSSHNTASRDRHELQTVLEMIPPGESPSSSASDIDNLHNTAANGDKAAQAKNSGSPQLAANLVISGRNRPNFSRLLSFAQDVNSAMEASRKSRIAFAAANGSQDNLKDAITSIKRALDFNFHDVDGLLRLVRLAKEAIGR